MQILSVYLTMALVIAGLVCMAAIACLMSEKSRKRAYRSFRRQIQPVRFK